MAKAKFNKAQREAHLVTVADMYLAGRRQVDIAAALGVDQSMVSRYLATLQERWQVAANERLEARKARELARLDRLEREYWVGWTRSTQNAETTVNRSKSTTVKAFTTEAGLIDVPAQESEMTRTSRGQAGDPRFLDGVMRCIEMRLRVIGGFAPAKVDISDLREKSDSELVNEFAELVDAARARAGSGDSGGA